MTRTVQAIRICRATFLCALLISATVASPHGVTAQATGPQGNPLHTSIDWSTVLGGDESSRQPIVTSAPDGCIYVAGISYGTWGHPIRDFTATGEFSPSDVFVAKLDPQGRLLWNTFLGGSDKDVGVGIALDGAGNIYVSGWVTAINAQGNRTPSGDAYGIDTFVAKLDSDGNLLWSTYLGSDEHDEYGRIVIDAAGSIYVTGSSAAPWSCSPTPCTARPFVGGEDPTDMDVYVAKLDRDGNLLWNSFLGGNANDVSEDITITPTGDLYVVGQSDGDWGCESAGCTRRAFTGDMDGFLAMLDSEGQLRWNSFFGGDGTDYPNTIVLRKDGQIAVSGQSNGAWSCAGVSCTLRPYAGDYDVFVAVADPDGVLQWNTFLGSEAIDRSTGLAAGTSGRLYVAGSSFETWGEPDRAYADWSDAMVAILASTGSLLWHSFIGSWDYQSGGGIALAGDDQVVLSGFGETAWVAPSHLHADYSKVFVVAFHPDIFPVDTKIWLPWAQVR